MGLVGLSFTIRLIVSLRGVYPSPTSPRRPDPGRSGLLDVSRGALVAFLRGPWSHFDFLKRLQRTPLGSKVSILSDSGLFSRNVVWLKPNLQFRDFEPPFSRHNFLKAALGGLRGAKVAFWEGPWGPFWRKKGGPLLVPFGFLFSRNAFLPM